MSAGVARASSCVPSRDSRYSCEIQDDEVMNVPDIRSRLKAQKSPFVANNNAGGGCVLYTQVEFMCLLCTDA